MKFASLATLATAALALSACSTYGDPLGGIFGGDRYRDGSYGYDPYGGPDRYGTGYSNDFERAAFNACGQRASQYGRVAIDRVDQSTRDLVRVIGRTDSRDSRRDGRIVDFRLY